MSGTADRPSTTPELPRTDGKQSIEPRQPSATAAEVRHVYQALRTLVPDRGRVSASDIAAVTDLDRDRVPAAIARLTRSGPFAIERDDAGERPLWEVCR